MSSGIRKLLLTAHISVSVGWIGAVLTYLVLVGAAMTAEGDEVLRAAWMGLDLIGWFVIVPLALAAVVTGFVMALSTSWGLFRHYWVLTSLILTIVATAVLLAHMPTVSSVASIAADPAATGVSDLLPRALWGEVLHAGVGLLLLLGIAALNVYKPRGLTRYGRKYSQVADSGSAKVMIAAPESVTSASGVPRWVHAIWIHAALLFLVLTVLQLVSGGLGPH